MRDNPFPQPSALDRRRLCLLIEAAQVATERGWTFGTAGNFSVRGRGGLVWQSPSGVLKGDLRIDHFIGIDLNSGRPRPGFLRRPSAETPIHLGVYRSDGEARCVVHCHPPALVEASESGDHLVFQGLEMQKHLGCEDHHQTLKVPVVENPRDLHTFGQNMNQETMINPRLPLLILAGHGVYAWGKDPLHVLSYIEACEFLCQTQHRR